MPVSRASSSPLVTSNPPIHKLPARIDGRGERMWLPPDKLPPEGAFVHVSECPDRLVNMSSVLDINNLCNKPWWSQEEEMMLRATSYVRPERPGLFFSAEGMHREVLAFVMPDATVVGGWPHDSWGTSIATQTLCPESETPGEYARRRLDHFVRHCAQADANRWWASNFTCFYRTRTAIEERQYAYLDLVKENGTKCQSGQLHNQIMVKWAVDKITRIFHSGTASEAALRLKTLLPFRQLWQYDVNVTAVLERCDTCCHEPDCPNPLRAPNSDSGQAAQQRRQQQQERRQQQQEQPQPQPQPQQPQQQQQQQQQLSPQPPPPSQQQQSRRLWQQQQ